MVRTMRNMTVTIMILEGQKRPRKVILSVDVNVTPQKDNKCFFLLLKYNDEK